MAVDREGQHHRARTKQDWPGPGCGGDLGRRASENISLCEWRLISQRLRTESSGESVPRQREERTNVLSYRGRHDVVGSVHPVFQGLPPRIIIGRRVAPS